MSTLTDTAPLAVWDVRDDSWTDRNWRERTAWASAHLDSVFHTYRAEFYLIDAPVAVLYRYRTNEDGRRYIDPATGDPAVVDPVRQLLDELPPEHLYR